MAKTNSRSSFFLMSLSLLLLFLSSTVTHGFVITPPRGRTISNKLYAASAASEERTTASSTEEELSPPQTRVFNLLTRIHESGHEFRVVVVGNGAILETTTVFGGNDDDMTTTCKVSKSPATGQPLMTLASNDQSFEFHVQLDKVSKICLVEKQQQEDNNKVMRILRFLTETGTPMCSLICTSNDAKEWFQDMIDQNGTEVQL